MYRTSWLFRFAKPCVGSRILVLFLSLLAWGQARADKTDIVELRSGDRVTCEIKRLERGRLQASTDSMGIVYIEWKDIVRVDSKELYVAELESGKRVRGRLMPAEDGQLVVFRGNKATTLAMDQVVWLDPLKLDRKLTKR
jgi:hypothetical protein